MEEVLTRKRLTREESRSLTRERLMDAAFQIFVNGGIEAASIEEVAEAAGYSRGAFYSNFESKEELLCAVLDREVQRESEQMEELMTASPREELIAKFRECYVQMSRDEAHCAFWLGLQLYALRNPAVRPHVAELVRKKRDFVVKLAHRVYAAIGQQPPGSVETVALGLISIAQGLAVTRMLDPEALANDSVPQSLETLFNQISGVS